MTLSIPKHTSDRKIFAYFCIPIISSYLVFIFQWQVIFPGFAQAENLFPSSKDTQVQTLQSVSKLPLVFELNEGQTDPQVRFLARGGGYTLYLTPAEAVFVLKKRAQGITDRLGDFKDKQSIQHIQTRKNFEVLRLRFSGGNRKAAFEGLEKSEGKSNYLIGNDPSKWHTNLSNYARVRVRDVYAGVDVEYYGNQGKLEYDFVVKPGFDPDVIGLEYQGAKKALVDNKGSLVFGFGKGNLLFNAPVVYQMVRNEKKFVDCQYVVVKSRRIGFKVGNYDKTRPLVIDPALFYSTYLGGSGDSVGDGDSLAGIAVDGPGNAYITGQVISTNFPTVGGAFQSANGNGGSSWTTTVSKLNPTGSALVYSTYLGGNGQDLAFGIAIDSSDNAYVTGYTTSTNFPTTLGAYQTSFVAGEVNNYVTKLNSTGSSLLYSTFVGIRYSNLGGGIAVDGLGCAYITGPAKSTGFPTTPGAFQTTYGGGVADAFVAKLNAAGSALVYSTFLGGNGPDEGFGIAVDGSGNAYITGKAYSSNFPTTSGAYSTIGGSFITELNSSGSALIYSTHLNATTRAIAIDGSGNAYVTGGAITGFPTTAGAFQTSIGGAGAGNAFVTKFNVTGTALVYSTFVGGNALDVGYGIAMDGSGNAYITGSATSTNFPTTPGAYQTVCGSCSGGNSNAFVTKLNATGSALVYSTYLGGSNDDQGLGIAIDGTNNGYVAGFTNSTNFPTTAGAFQTSYPGTLAAGGYSNTQDGFVSKLSMDTPTPTITPTPTPTNTPLPTGLHVWPNPYIHSSGSGYFHAGYVVPGTTMNIYTISGETVIANLGPTNGIINWDSRNQSGVYVSTGVYFYTIKNGNKVLLTGSFQVLNR